MDCKNNYNCNCLGITLSFARSLSHLFGALTQTKEIRKLMLSVSEVFFKGLIVLALPQIPF